MISRIAIREFLKRRIASQIKRESKKDDLDLGIVGIGGIMCPDEIAYLPFDAIFKEVVLELVANGTIKQVRYSGGTYYCHASVYAKRIRQINGEKP